MLPLTDSKLIEKIRKGEFPNIHSRSKLLNDAVLRKSTQELITSHLTYPLSAQAEAGVEPGFLYFNTYQQRVWDDENFSFSNRSLRDKVKYSKSTGSRLFYSPDNESFVIQGSLDPKIIRYSFPHQWKSKNQKLTTDNMLDYSPRLVSIDSSEIAIYVPVVECEALRKLEADWTKQSHSNSKQLVLPRR